jgi:hypothetical protein
MMQWHHPEADGLEGCLGLALLPLMLAPTPPRGHSSDSETTPPKYLIVKGKIDKESPKSVTDESFFVPDLASKSGHSVLTPQRERGNVRRRKAGKRTKSPFRQARDILEQYVTEPSTIKKLRRPTRVGMRLAPGCL